MTQIRADLKYSYHGNLLKNLYDAFLMCGRFKLIAHSVSFPVSSLYSDYLSSALSRLLFFSLLEIDCLLPSQRHMVLIDSLYQRKEEDWPAGVSDLNTYRPTANRLLFMPHGDQSHIKSKKMSSSYFT